MRTFIVIPEGLATDTDGYFYVSDYYAAALELVILECKVGDRIFLAPANSFGAKQEEDYFGRDYLISRKCNAEIELIDEEFQRDTYLDTLDNAIYLKEHLIRNGKWPLDPVILICNKPHKFRGWIMFSLCGYSISKVLVSRPVIRTERQIVKRLWFYDVEVVQYFYETAAILHNIIKFILKQSNFKVWFIW